MMLDITLKQVELQDTTSNLGVYNDTCRDILLLLTKMLAVRWEGEHSCVNDEDITDCVQCERSAVWNQLNAKLMEFIAPRDCIKLPVKDLPKVNDIQARSEKHQSEMKEKREEEKDENKEDAETPEPE